MLKFINEKERLVKSLFRCSLKGSGGISSQFSGLWLHVGILGVWLLDVGFCVDLWCLVGGW